MIHKFETLPEKMFRLFGETTFKPGSFKFKFMKEVYDIVGVEPGRLYYGDSGFYLKSEDATQFIVTDVNHVRKKICDPVVIHIEDRSRYLRDIQ